MDTDCPDSSTAASNATADSNQRPRVTPKRVVLSNCVYPRLDLEHNCTPRFYSRFQFAEIARLSFLKGATLDRDSLLRFL